MGNLGSIIIECIQRFTHQEQEEQIDIFDNNNINFECCNTQITVNDDDPLLFPCRSGTETQF